jgi:short subunit fatty acids transporter
MKSAIVKKKNEAHPIDEQTIRQVVLVFSEKINPMSTNTLATRLMESAILSLLNSSRGFIVCMVLR